VAFYFSHRYDDRVRPRILRTDLTSHYDPPPTRPHPLLQHNIVELVLAYCESDIPSSLRYTISNRIVPNGSLWFAAVAQTCKTWLDPALRRLYHTVNLDARYERGGLMLSVDIVARIGHWIRTLVVKDYVPPAMDSGLNAAFHHFTSLTSLILRQATERPTTAEDNPRMSAILSGLSFPYLANLDISSYHSSSLLTLLGTIRNLRRLRFTLPPGNPDHSLPDHSLGVTALDKLEDLEIHTDYCGYREALAPTLTFLLACHPPLIALKLSWLQLLDTDYSLVTRLIRASSQSLRAISFVHLRRKASDTVTTGEPLLHALASCTSVLPTNSLASC
jgi:hypothetical protein